MKINIPLAIIGVAIFAGGIYLYTRSPQSELPSPSPTTPSSVTGTQTEPKNAASPAPVSSSALPEINDTWNTYSSKALGFSFQWPTKGRNAPTWEVTSGDKDCVGVENVDEHVSTTFDVNGVSFCHTSYSDGAAGNLYLIDAYTTKHGSRYATITFTKHVTNAGALGCSFVAEHPYSTSATTCIPFEEDVYKAHLDQIVSTYKPIE